MSGEVVIGVRNSRSIRNLLLGALLLLAFAAGSIAGVAGVDDLPVGERVVMGLLGAVCLAVGLGCVVALVVSVQRRDLVVDPDGLGWRTARGTAWHVRWVELASVAVHTGFARGPGTRRYARVSLVLEGADPGFLARHRALRQVRDPRGTGATVRIPLVDRTELVGPLAAALAEHAGARFAGVVDDGRVGNLGDRPRPR